VTGLIPEGDGSTPLSAEEMADLIPDLATRQELNEWERENILRAREWAMRERTSPVEMASDSYVRRLHRKMFGETWKWAGQYRSTAKNIGVQAEQVRDRLMQLFGDVRYWLEHGTYVRNEIAVRFHYGLVFIHPFPNGNGRHARLAADILSRKLGGTPFSWGSANLGTAGEARARYLAALRAADQGDLQPLLTFADS
jgi:Fic-DOC domain mobile mystery protein B